MPLLVRIASVLVVGIGTVGLAAPGYGQACTEESVAERPDTWRETPANLVLAGETAPAVMHPRILKRIEPIAAMFREAYPAPRGTGAEGYKAIRRFGPEQDGGPAQYGYVSLYKTWLCPKTTKQAERAGETGNWAYVYVNSVHYLLKEVTDKPLPVDGRPTKVWLLARRIGSLRGEPLYEPWMGLSFGRALVFARPGAFPWKPLSQRQYLDAVEAWWTEATARGNDAADAAILAIERNIAEMKKTLTGEMRDKVVPEMERSLAEARARRPADRAKAAAGLATALKPIQDYRAGHEGELSQPAILPEGMGSGFNGTFGTEAEGGHRVVTLDPEYFRSDLPADAAQLITLLWRSEDGPAAIAWRDSFERGFPIDKLRALLGH